MNTVKMYYYNEVKYSIRIYFFLPFLHCLRSPWNLEHNIPFPIEFGFFILGKYLFLKCICIKDLPILVASISTTSQGQCHQVFFFLPKSAFSPFSMDSFLFRILI